MAALLVRSVLASLLISGASAATLRGPVATKPVEPSHVLAAVNSSKANAAPCTCVASSPTWKPCPRTEPRCVFIDLGAANGNTFDFFMKDGYGPVKNCPNKKWSAVLVEANPRFNEPLAKKSSDYPQLVNAMSSTAAYMCEAQTSFFLDTVNTQNNFWGSSMSANHRDVQRSGKTKVTVPTMNLNRILYEQTIPGDWVMVKMDIEGAEWDVLPCVAKSSSASLIDRLYLEQHQPSWGQIGTTPFQMEAAKNQLRSKGVDIPNYFSHTL